MDNSRTEILIGKENLEKIKNAHVTIVGCGGVGGYCAVFLARAGVEKFTLIDFDKVSPSNLNRQVIAYESTIGRAKVEVLKDMLLAINSEVKVNGIDARATEDNLPSLIKDTDIVIDAIDSVKDKIALILYCKKHYIYIISAMGAGNRYDTPNFYLTDIYKTHDDGLAKAIRKKLRENNVNSLDVVTCNSKPQKVDGVIGSISYYPASSGATIASVVINKIIKEEIC